MTRFLINFILDQLDPQPVPVPETLPINWSRVEIRKASRSFELKKRGLSV